MKRMLLALSLVTALSLGACGTNKFPCPVLVVAHADVKNTGVSQGTVQPGDTVGLTLPMIPIAGNVQVTLRSGKRGYLPAAALGLPDSLKAKL